jgi:hypothetical protein
LYLGKIIHLRCIVMIWMDQMRLLEELEQVLELALKELVPV